MTDYAAEFDRILADYRAGSRGVREQFLEVDARTTGRGAELFAELREKLRDEQEQRSETSGEVAADERAERDRLLSEEAGRARTRAAERRKPPSVGRDVVVMPSDWTDEDEARAEGYGPPESWLR